VIILPLLVKGAIASGAHSVALGSYSTAAGDKSVAMGPYAKTLAGADFSFAMGNLVEANGRMGIGKPDPEAALDVAGKIICNEVEVTSVGKWKDYVFDNDYDLPKLHVVENFIAEYGHLPEIPSETEVLENGYDLSEMDARLLQKIEELTLYVIDLKKEINQLKGE
jgi:hypothetical protein